MIGFSSQHSCRHLAGVLQSCRCTGAYLAVTIHRCIDERRWRIGSETGTMCSSRQPLLLGRLHGQTKLFVSTAVERRST
jgi:hypothetical protein